MAKKEWMVLPWIIGLAVLLAIVVIVVIVTRPESSWLAQGVQWLSEGFAVSGPDSDIPQCPRSFQFFNDKKGDSFCCGVPPDPYKHTCPPNQACSLTPGKRDERTSQPIPLCGDLVRAQQEQQERELCPKSLTNHAWAGRKCCQNPSNFQTGDCQATDLANTNSYCVTEGPMKQGETRCISLRLNEEATCPDGFQKSIMGLAGDVTGPVCYNLQKRGFCYPENTIDEIQRQGYWKQKNKNNWIEACDVWKKVNIDRDTTLDVDMTGPA